MNKLEFLNELREKLHFLNEEEHSGYVSYYAELLADMIEEGKSEEEAVASIESIDSIVDKIRNEFKEEKGRYHMIKPRKNSDNKILFFVLVAVIIGILMVGGWITRSTEDFVEDILDDNKVREDAESREYMAEAMTIKELEIQWIYGDIELSVWDKDYVSVSEFFEEKLDENMVMQIEEDHNTLEIKQFSRKNVENAPNKRLEIKMPLKIAKDIEQIDIQTVASDVEISSDICADELNIQSVMGQSVVYCNFDEIDIETVSGDVELRGHDGQGIEFITVSGKLESNLIYSSRGKKYTYGNGKDIKINTVSGDLTIE